MAKYGVSNILGGTNANVTSSFVTKVSLTSLTGATTLRRAWIYEIEVGPSAAPSSTDCEIVYQTDRQSTVGTATAVTPSQLDSADAAALITANANNTVEPTVTANTTLVYIPVNQRLSYRWAVAPGSGAELIVPATTTTGIGTRVKSGTYTLTVGVNWNFYE